jgi:hypothetical protein
MADNLLYYGDNIDILRRYLKDETVDLVYLDATFKSNQVYTILFAAQDGSRSAGQIKVSQNTWRWKCTASAREHSRFAGKSLCASDRSTQLKKQERETY